MILDAQNDSLTWVPPAMESMKINFDGSFCSDSLSGRVGVVIRDWRGDFVCVNADRCLADSALLTECWVALLALFIAHEMGLS